MWCSNILHLELNIMFRIVMRHIDLHFDLVKVRTIAMSAMHLFPTLCCLLTQLMILTWYTLESWYKWNKSIWTDIDHKHNGVDNTNMVSIWSWIVFHWQWFSWIPLSPFRETVYTLLKIHEVESNLDFRMTLIYKWYFAKLEHFIIMKSATLIQNSW